MTAPSLGVSIGMGSVAVMTSSYPQMRRRFSLPEVVDGCLADDHPLRGSVIALGNFDGFHLGHQALARMARHLADGRPVAVMSCEPHPRTFFGKEKAPFRLATPGTKRLQLGAYGVDFIFSPVFDQAFAGLSPVEFVERALVGALGVRHVIAGPDFRFGNKRGGDMALLSKLGAVHGFGVGIAPEVTHAGIRVSSTLIRAAIEAGDLSGANRLMGHAWIVETERTRSGALGLHHALCRPRPGLYIGRAEESGDQFPVDIGVNGEFLPLRPLPLRVTPEMWRLEGQVRKGRAARHPSAIG